MADNYDPHTAAPVTFGKSKGYLAARTDVRPEEQCFVALTEADKRFVGYIQKFKDGSVGYWKVLGEVAKPAPNLEQGLTLLFTQTISLSGIP